VVPEEVMRSVQLLQSSNCHEKSQALCELRKVLSTPGPPLDLVVSCDVVPKLVVCTLEILPNRANSVS